MKKGEMLNNMLLFAVQNHAGQFDKGGNPYILHTLAVMQLLRTEDEELQCIALGHDVVEDCGVSYQDLRDIGMSERVVEGIRCMTKIPGETHEEYKEKVKSNPDSIKVKMCDLEHNSDIKRIKGLRDKDFERTIKYQKFYVELREFLNEDSLVVIQTNGSERMRIVCGAPTIG